MNKENPQKKYIVVFDIDSGSVGGSVLEYSFTKKGEVDFVRSFISLRKDISDGAQYDYQRFWKKAQKTFDALATEIYLHALVPISGIFCNVGSPWISSQKRITQYQPKKGDVFTVDENLLAKLEQKDLKTSLKKNLNYHQYDVELIDRKVLDYYINGYPIKDPLNATARTFEVHSLVSVMSRKTKKSFEGIIQKHFHRDPIFLSNPYVFYYGVKTLLPHNDNALIFDIGTELTEILIIENDHLRNFGVFPSGVHTILRDLSSRMGLSMLEARNTLELFTERAFTDSYAELLEEDSEKAFHSWLKPFYNALDEFSKKGLLPNTLVLKTHDTLSLWFERMILSHDELGEHLLTNGRIELISFENALPYVFNEIEDIEMKLLAHYISEQKDLFSQSDYDTFS